MRTMILPMTARSAMRFKPWPKSARSITLSITGSTSREAILANPSATLRRFAPNDPMMRTCCWKIWNRFVSAEMPLVEPQVTSRPPRFSESRLARRQAHVLGGQPIAVASHDAAIGDVLAEILLAAQAGRAMPADHPGIEHHPIARLAVGHTRPRRGDLARPLDAGDDGQLALGKGHTAKAPEVDVIEGHGLHAHDDLARSRCRG